MKHVSIEQCFTNAMIKLVHCEIQQIVLIALSNKLQFDTPITKLDLVDSKSSTYSPIFAHVMARLEIGGSDYVLCEIFNLMRLSLNIVAKSFRQRNVNIGWLQCTLDGVIITFSILMRIPFLMQDEREVKHDLQIIVVLLYFSFLPL